MKEFKSIEDQLGILESREIEIDPMTEHDLMAHGYFNVVNGYRDFFVDRDASQGSPHIVYRPGTTFRDIFSLYRFDSELREITLRYILEAERVFKNVLFYSFCEKHGSPSDYLDRKFYGRPCGDTAKRMRHESDLSWIIDKNLRYEAIERKNCKPYIEHYRLKGETPPLWVVGKTLSFSAVRTMYTVCEDSIRDATCRRITELRDGGKSKNPLDRDELSSRLSTLVDVRNICAHGDRLFCTKLAPGGNARYHDVIAALDRILPRDSVTSMIRQVAETMFQAERQSDLVLWVFEQLGWKRIPEEESGNRMEKEAKWQPVMELPENTLRSL